MRRNRLPMLIRSTGSVLMIVGFSVLWIGIGIVIPLGLLQTFIFGWFVALLFGVAGFLLVDLGFRRSLRAMLLGFGITIPWSLILLIQLPDELQFLLASSVALVGVLFYKRYQTRKSREVAHVERNLEEDKPEQKPSPLTMPQSVGTPSTLRKAIGVLLIIVNLSIFYIVFSAVFSNHSLFLSVLASLPVVSPVMVIASLTWRRTNLKGAVEGWIFFVIITLIPFAVVFPLVLPLSYQIPYIGVLVIAFVSFIYWLRSVRSKNRQKRKSSISRSMNQ